MVADICPDERRLIRKYTKMAHILTKFFTISMSLCFVSVFIVPHLVSVIMPDVWLVWGNVQITGIPKNAHPGYDLHMLVVSYGAFCVTLFMMVIYLSFAYCAIYVLMQFDVCRVMLRRLGRNRMGESDNSQLLRSIIVRHTRTVK